MPLLELLCEFVIKTSKIPKLIPSNSLLFGVLYWYVWTIWIPRRNNYSLEETVETLDDGTTVTTLVQVPIGSKLVPTTEQETYDE
jgi:hypothetical protein